jgi:4-hydroxybenzoate polyprenyltransferase
MWAFLRRLFDRALPSRRRPAWVSQMTGLFVPLTFFFLLYVLYLCAGRPAVPSLRSWMAALATYATQAFLYGYNNYRGRAEDTLSPKVDFRPLAGRGERSRAFEVALAGAAVAGIAIPLVVGSVGQAVLNALAAVTYPAAFENRYASRPLPLLKTASAVLAVSLTIAGFLASIGADAAVLWQLLVVVTVWRIGFEAAWDALDEHADHANGIVTPVTRWGTRRTLVVVGVGCGLGFTVVTGWALTAMDWPDAAIGALGVFALGACVQATVEAGRCGDQTARDSFRVAMNVLLTVGLGTVLAAERSVVLAGTFVAFRMAGPVRYWLGRTTPEWMRDKGPAASADADRGDPVAASRDRRTR